MGDGMNKKMFWGSAAHLQMATRETLYAVGKKAL